MCPIERAVYDDDDGGSLVWLRISKKTIINIANIKWCCCYVPIFSGTEYLLFILLSAAYLAIMASWVIIKIHFQHFVSFLCAAGEGFYWMTVLMASSMIQFCKSYKVLQGIGYLQIINIFSVIVRSLNIGFTTVRHDMRFTYTNVSC